MSYSYQSEDGDVLNDVVPGTTRTYNQYLSDAMATRETHLQKFRDLADVAWRVHGLTANTEKNKLAAKRLAISIVKLSTMLYLSFSASEVENRANWWLVMSVLVNDFYQQLLTIQELFRRVNAFGYLMSIIRKREIAKEINTHEITVAVRQRKFARGEEILREYSAMREHSATFQEQQVYSY